MSSIPVYPSIHPYSALDLRRLQLYLASIKAIIPIMVGMESLVLRRYSEGGGRVENGVLIALDIHSPKFWIRHWYYKVGNRTVRDIHSPKFWYRFLVYKPHDDRVIDPFSQIFIW
jgi:hypothetical protein